MQQNKNIKDFSELKLIISDSEKMTSSLTDLTEIFNLKKHFSVFNGLKTKGYEVASILKILLILPFYGASSIYALFKTGMNKQDFVGKKDIYYDIKNNENIDWRTLLLLHVKRFRYLVNTNKNIKSTGTTAIIFDDTKIEKTGKKIERVSLINDHVTGRFVLGFKLLVCGFWDGASFIPIDFSLHREKGSKQEKLASTYKNAVKKEQSINSQYIKCQKNLKKKENSLQKAQELCSKKNNTTHRNRLKKNESAFEKSKQNLDSIKKQLSEFKLLVAKYKTAVAKNYTKGTLYGLTLKERKEQYKKPITKGSCGNIRRHETDIDKISNMIAMLKRAVKNGIIADYLLCDSWFFCFELLNQLQSLRNGVIKLVSMVKINNQIFTDINDRKMSVKKMPFIYSKNIQNCRKLKAKYIKIPCFYQGIRVNLFFIKMGKASAWHLILTNDLDMNFIQLMEVYQIRWSIEVFFKESKQYLNLDACQSSNFDGQIADITLSMIQHIMLSYLKRKNYMQSIGNLFQKLCKEVIEIDLITRLLEIFWKIIRLLCENSGFDFFEFQKDALNNDDILRKLISIIPEKSFDKAA